MDVLPLTLAGLRVIRPNAHGDSRGFFMEAYNARDLRDAGIKHDVVQHNQSRSQQGVVRGLHFQWDKPLSKLIRVTRGRAWTVSVDMRVNSPSLGRWEARELSENSREILYAPFGFATGFAALEDSTEIEYYYDAYYNKEGESNILWNDPTLDIRWPIKNPILSDRDKAAQSFATWLERPESKLFTL